MWSVALLLLVPVAAEDLVRGELTSHAKVEQERLDLIRGEAAAQAEQALKQELETAVEIFAGALATPSPEQVGAPDRTKCRTEDALDMIFPDSDASRPRRKYDLRIAVAGDAYDKNMYLAVRDLLISDVACEVNLNKLAGQTDFLYSLKCKAGFSVKVTVKPPQSGFLGVVLAIISGEKNIQGGANVDFRGKASQQPDPDKKATSGLKWVFEHEKEVADLDLGSDGVFFDLVLKIVQPFLNMYGGVSKQIWEKARQLLQRFLPFEEATEVVAKAEAQGNKIKDQANAKVSDRAAVALRVALEGRTAAIGEPMFISLDMSDQFFYPADDLWTVLSEDLKLGTSAEVDVLEATKGVDINVHTDVASSPDQNSLMITQGGSERERTCVPIAELRTAPIFECADRGSRIVEVRGCSQASSEDEELSRVLRELSRRIESEVNMETSGFSSMDPIAIQDIQTEIEQLRTTLESGMGNSPSAKRPQLRQAYEWMIQKAVSGCIGKSRCALTADQQYDLRRIGKDVQFECAAARQLNAVSATVRGGEMVKEAGALLKVAHFEQTNALSSNFFGMRTLMGGGYGPWTGPAEVEWTVLNTDAGVLRFLLLATPGQSSYDDNPVELRTTAYVDAAASPGMCTTGGNAPEGTSCMYPFTWKSKTYTECTDVDHNRPWCSTHIPGDWGNCKPCPSGTPQTVFTSTVSMLESAQYIELAAHHVPAGAIRIKVELVDPTRDLQDHKRTFTIRGLLVTKDASRPTRLQLPQQLLPLVDKLGLELGEGVQINLGNTDASIPTRLIGNKVSDALAGARRPVRNDYEGNEAIPAWMSAFKGSPLAEGRVGARPREWPKLVGMDIRELVPKHKVSLDLETSVAELDLGAGSGPQMVGLVGLGVTALVDLPGLMQLVANPHADTDFGYIFAAAPLEERKKGKEKKRGKARNVLLNCGYLQFYDSASNLNDATPAELLAIEDIMAVGLDQISGTDQACAVAMMQDGSEKRLCGKTTVVADVYDAIHTQHDRFLLMKADGVDVGADLHPRGQELPEKDLEPVRPLLSFFR